MRMPILTVQLNGRFKLARRYCSTLPNGKFVDIPAGTLTNFASIPWYARWIISPIDPTIVTAAFVHDYLVGEFNGVPGVLIHQDGTKERVSWEQAAAILRAIMDEKGARTWKRQAVYWAVRLHGVFR